MNLAAESGDLGDEVPEEVDNSEPVEPAIVPDSATPRWVLPTVLLLALGLRIPGIGESVWLDELYTSRLLIGDPVLLLRTLYYDTHPPLYFLMMHGWTGLVGDAELALRLPPLLFGIAGIAVVWRLGALLAGPVAGLVAALLLTLSPVHIWYSQEARPYAFSMCAVSVAALAFFQLFKGAPAKRWALLFSVALFCSTFTHFYNAFALVAFFVIALASVNPRRLHVLWPCCIIGTLLGLYLAARLMLTTFLTSAYFLRPFDLAELWQLLFNWYLVGNSLWPRDVAADPTLLEALWIVQIAAVAVAARGVWRLSAPPPSSAAPTGGWRASSLMSRALYVLLGRGRESRVASGAPLVAVTLALPIGLLMFSLVGLDHTYIERSTMPALPLFLTLLAAGVTNWHHRVTRSIAAMVTILAAAVGTGVYFSQEGHHTVYKPHPDWRGAAAHLSAAIDADGDRRGVVIVPELMVGPAGATTWVENPLPLTYYDGRIQQAKLLVPDHGKFRDFMDRVGQLFGTGSRPAQFVRDSFSAYCDNSAALRDRTRLSVISMRAGTRLELPCGHDHGRIFVLTMMLHEEWLPEWLQELRVDGACNASVWGDAYRVVDRRSWRALWLWELDRPK